MAEKPWRQEPTFSTISWPTVSRNLLMAVIYMKYPFLVIIVTDVHSINKCVLVGHSGSCLQSQNMES